MASFDIKTFGNVLGNTGTSPFEAVGASFGLPSCMLNLAKEALALLPTGILSNIQNKIFSAKAKGEEDAKQLVKKLMLATGIIEYDTEDGTIKFKSISNLFGLDGGEGSILDDLGGAIDAFNYAASFGAELYAQYQNVANEINAIIDCLDKFKTMQQYQSGNSATQKSLAGLSGNNDYEALSEAAYAGDKAQLSNTVEFINKCDTKIREINEIVLARELDPNLEPCFLDSAELDPFLSGTSFKRCSASDPGVQESESEDVFRLSYGPPVTTKGQYVLTNDGLYYDSRTGGLDPVYLAISGIVPLGEAWKYSYDPNLGGKGDTISIESLNKFTDNIFDPERIDDSKGMQKYYNEDHFLSVLIQQRDKQIYDLSSSLTFLISRYGEGTSIVKNQRQLIISEIANHNSKINRRKKQLEVAAKAPQIYGGETSPKFAPGEVPINDFSYLEDYNLLVDLEKQKALIFAQSEVNGVVLPVSPVFVNSPSKPDSIEYDHLKVPTVGRGSILYTPSSLNAGAVLSLNDLIVNDKLFAIYNFLETDLVLPSSVSFKTTNCATEDMYNNGQLAAPSKQSIFFSGLGIPYLEGIVKNKSSDPAGASAMGSYFRLPDSAEFRDMTYSPEGFTMECWVHVPNIMDGDIGWLSATTSSLTKVLLGCENVGAKEGDSLKSFDGTLADLDYLPNDKGDQLVRGMLCGFTRDRRITQENTGYSNDNKLNAPASSLSFFLAPTLSRDSSSASFINNSECQNQPSYHKMKVDLSSTQFGNVSSNFVLVDISFDPKNDKISFFADGALVTTSSMSTVFGTDYGVPLNIPNFKKNNSFNYTSSSVDGPSTLKTGPKINPYFTPWIVGGGYTDGMYQYGNFMGGDRGGIISGLRGHIGSLKFYAKPLDTNEVLKNYKAQQGFFKTILI